MEDTKLTCEVIDLLSEEYLLIMQLGKLVDMGFHLISNQIFQFTKERPCLSANSCFIISWLSFDMLSSCWQVWAIFGSLYRGLGRSRRTVGNNRRGAKDHYSLRTAVCYSLS